MSVVDSQFSFTWYLNLDGDCSEAIFRVFPSSQSKQEIPFEWEVNYVSPVRGQLIWELLQLLFKQDDRPVITCVMDIISSKKIEDWPYALAKLRPGKVGLVFHCS